MIQCYVRMSDAHGRSVWDGQRGLGGGDQPCARAWRPGEISRQPASTQGGTMAPRTPVTILPDSPGFRGKISSY